MKITLIKNPRWLVLAILIFAMCPMVEGQETDPKMKIDCVSFRMIAQKPAPKIKEKPAPDVIVETPDDIHLQFELENNCDQRIYYLAYNLRDHNTAPAGFMIYRDKEDQWTARSPGWRREGDLTGVNYHWLPIETGGCLKFEGSDLSLIEGERSIAIYVNYSPSHVKRVEIMAVPFTIRKM